jgi:hypothetical protein
MEKMNNKIKNFVYATLYFSLLLSLSVQGIIYAASDCAGGNASACLKTGKAGEVMQILASALSVLGAFVIIGATIMLIVGGIQYSVSAGNPQAVAEAKKKITNVLIGVVAFVFLYAFLEWLIPGGVWYNI